MDTRLEEKLRQWHKKIDLLHEAELLYRELSGTEKSMWGQLYLVAEGKDQKTREANVYNSDEWRNYQVSLAEATSNFNKAKRIENIAAKAYEAEYLTMKVEADAIRKAM